MRRKDKEILDPDLIERILAEARVCRLGLCRGEEPYVVPVAFGGDRRAIYFHTAREGTKIEIMSANPRVCFEVEHQVEVVASPGSACGWTFSFSSVIGFGRVVEILEPAARVQALNQIMRHYSGRDWEFSAEALAATRLWKIEVERITGKQSKDKITV